MQNMEKLQITQGGNSTRQRAVVFGLLGLISATRGFAAAGTTNAVPAQANEHVFLLGVLEKLAGGWIHQAAFAGFTWGQLIISAVVLFAVGLAAQVLHLILRRQARKRAPKGGEAGKEVSRLLWIKLTLEALIPPLTLYLWVWGVYAAFAVLFAQTAEQETTIANVVRWANRAGQVIALFWFLFRMIKVVESQLRRWTAGTDSKWDDVIVVVVVKALRLVVPLIGIILIVPALDLPEASQQLFRQGASLVLIGAVGFILYQLVHAVEISVMEQFRVDVRDNLAARRINTQVKVLKKIAVVVIILFSAASMLMVFESVRQLGTSILASAGVLGIIVGFAAQKSIATVLAGFQIAMTQPIRLDDVVIVEGEWGRIEEITLTYVVVLIWDQRRLVVPISYFIEKPFQNWTRVSAELLGTIFLYMDYTVPLDKLRAELDRLLAETDMWDKRVKVVQVTDSKERVIEVRVLVSAADASTAWNLRCMLREKLIGYLQRNHPESLPRTRAELSNPEGAEKPLKP